MPKQIEKKADTTPKKKAANGSPPYQQSHGITFPGAVLNAFFISGAALLALGGIIFFFSHIAAAALCSAGVALLISGIIFNFVAARPSLPALGTPDLVNASSEPDKQDSEPHFQRPATWRYGLFVLFITLSISALTILFGAFLAKKSFEAGYKSSVAAYTPATPTNATQTLPDGRILLTDMTPEYLDHLSRKHTETEAIKLMEGYFDKWLVFGGAVDNLSNLDFGDRKISTLWITRPEPFSRQSASFTDVGQIERLQPLRKGNPVKVLCKITLNRQINDVNLDNCEMQPLE